MEAYIALNSTVSLVRPRWGGVGKDVENAEAKRNKPSGCKRGGPASETIAFAKGQVRCGRCARRAQTPNAANNPTLVIARARQPSCGKPHSLVGQSILKQRAFVPARRYKTQHPCG